MRGSVSCCFWRCCWTDEQRPRQELIRAAAAKSRQASRQGRCGVPSPVRLPPPVPSAATAGEGATASSSNWQVQPPPLPGLLPPSIAVTATATDRPSSSPIAPNRVAVVYGQPRYPRLRNRFLRSTFRLVLFRCLACPVLSCPVLSRQSYSILPHPILSGLVRSSSFATSLSYDPILSHPPPPRRHLCAPPVRYGNSNQSLNIRTSTPTSTTSCSWPVDGLCSARPAYLIFRPSAADDARRLSSMLAAFCPSSSAGSRLSAASASASAALRPHRTPAGAVVPLQASSHSV